MGRVPVRATVAQAYRFAFGGFVDLVRLTWLPQLLIVGLMFTLLWPAMIEVLGAAGSGVPPNGGRVLIFLLAYVFMVMLVFAQIAAIARAALGLKGSEGWLHFPAGRPVWRLIGAFLLLLLVFLGVALAMILVSAVMGAITGLIGLAGGLAMTTVSRIIALVVMVLVYGVFAVAVIRLGFLLTPVVIAEERISLRRAWTLSGGNFWRLLAVALGTMLPVVVLETLLFRFLPAAPQPQPGQSAQQSLAAVLDWETGLLTLVQSHWQIVAPVLFVLTILIYGLFIGAQCFAYRAVMDETPEA